MIMADGPNKFFLGAFGMLATVCIIARLEDDSKTEMACVNDFWLALCGDCGRIRLVSPSAQVLGQHERCNPSR
jgi:hypothetical protein